MTSHCLHLLVLELVVRALTHVTFDLKSTLLRAEVIAIYLLAKENIRNYLKLITLEDHQWNSRSLDHKFVGVEKVNCVECCKEFGSTTRYQSKNKIHNLIANFVKKITSCLTYIFEIGAKERKFSLVIIPNHKPIIIITRKIYWLGLQLTMKHYWLQAFRY